MDGQRPSPGKEKLATHRATAYCSIIYDLVVNQISGQHGVRETERLSPPFHPYWTISVNSREAGVGSTPSLTL